MSNTYIRIRLKRVPHQLEEAFTKLAFKCGANGVSELLPFTQHDLRYDPEISHQVNHDLELYFSERPGCEFFDQVIEISPEQQWEITEEETKDWLAEWKKGFDSFRLVGDYWIVPSWLEAPQAAKTPLYIDPGMAFGTGTHATTQMASYLLNRYVKTSGDCSHRTMIDVGTGTGVLSILAEKMGFGEIHALDIDPEARRVSRENVVKNQCQRIEVLESQIEDQRLQFDLVVANIIDGVLIQLRKDLVKAMSPEGDMIVTGILKQHEEEFVKYFIDASGLKIVQFVEDHEWIGFWLKK